MPMFLTVFMKFTRIEFILYLFRIHGSVIHIFAHHSVVFIHTLHANIQCGCPKCLYLRIACDGPSCSNSTRT